jgi:hypothetical protein
MNTSRGKDIVFSDKQQEMGTVFACVNFIDALEFVFVNNFVSLQPQKLKNEHLA